MARVEVGRRLGRLDDGQVVRKLRVERLADALGGRTALHLDRRDVAERVDAGIRAAGDRELRPAGEDRLQRLPQDSLHSAQLRLCRPAPEGRAVVLER